MKKINHLLPEALFLIFILTQSNCIVDIEGAPCDPQLDNCPSGQYCSEEGVCRRGVKSIKDVMSDVSSEDRAEVRDIKEDIIVSEDADVFYYDVSPDVTDISDAGCSNKCNKGEKVCISQYSINECVFNNDTGCYEWSGEKFCNTPPENKCNGNTAIVYDPDGECKNNNCEYEYKEILCQFGCENGKCKNCTSDCSNKQCGDDGCGGSCGSCNTNAKCEDFKCICYADFGNCDNNWDNGCETNLKSNIENCGNCGVVCKVNNGTPKCEGKTCKIDICDLNYGDCNGIYNDGCEEKLDSVLHCGGCGEDCSKKNWPMVSEYKCIPTALETYTCDIDECVTNYANCNAVTTDGCEVNIYTDANNCGGCGKVCDADKMHVVTPLCKNGNCDYDKCKIAWEDMNGSRVDGCETYNYFPKTYGRVNISEEASAIIPIKGGEEGFFFVGNSGNYILVVRIDINGNILWSKNFGDNINLYYSTNAFPEVDANGVTSLLIVGSTKTSTSNHKDLLVLKLSDKGDILWKFTFSSSSTIGANKVATSILKIRDSYMILGNIYLNNNDSDILVIRLNSNRDIVWAKSYTYDNVNNPGTIVSENAFSIYNTPDGNYVIGGSTSLNNSDFLLILLNGNGDTIGAYNFGTNNPDYGKVVIPLENGYIIGGFNKTDSSFEDVAVIFYNKYFSAYWANTYGDNRANILINMNPTNNGYIISGQTSSANNSYEGLLMNISKDGNVIWQKSYGGKNWDMFVNAIQLSDTGFISFGRSISFTNDYDLWVVKTDQSGNVPGSCPSGFSTSLNLLKKTFPISLSNYPIKTTTLSIDIPAIPVLNVNDESININMQCSKP